MLLLKKVVLLIKIVIQVQSWCLMGPMSGSHFPKDVSIKIYPLKPRIFFAISINARYDMF